MCTNMHAQHTDKQYTLIERTPGGLVFLGVLDSKDVNSPMITGHTHQRGVVIEVYTGNNKGYLSIQKCKYMRLIYVTGFAKTIPIGTTIEIHFMA